MKVKPLRKISKPAEPFDYERFGKLVRRLSGADFGGLRMNISPRPDGMFDAGVQCKLDGTSWTSEARHNPLEALEAALLGKARVLRSHYGVPLDNVIEPTKSE